MRDTTPCRLWKNHPVALLVVRRPSQKCAFACTFRRLGTAGGAITQQGWGWVGGAWTPLIVRRLQREMSTPTRGSRPFAEEDLWRPSAVQRRERAVTTTHRRAEDSTSHTCDLKAPERRPRPVLEHADPRFPSFRRGPVATIGCAKQRAGRHHHQHAAQTPPPRAHKVRLPR
jgi:hypothetical protein